MSKPFVVSDCERMATTTPMTPVGVISRKKNYIGKIGNEAVNFVSNAFCCKYGNICCTLGTVRRSIRLNKRSNYKRKFIYRGNCVPDQIKDMIRGNYTFEAAGYFWNFL